VKISEFWEKDIVPAFDVDCFIIDTALSAKEKLLAKRNGLFYDSSNFDF
jgi:hypothetical protein